MRKESEAGRLYNLMHWYYSKIPAVIYTFYESITLQNIYRIIDECKNRRLPQDLRISDRFRIVYALSQDYTNITWIYFY